MAYHQRGLPGRMTAPSVVPVRASPIEPQVPMAIHRFIDWTAWFRRVPCTVVGTCTFRSSLRPPPDDGHRQPMSPQTLTRGGPPPWARSYRGPGGGGYGARRDGTADGGDGTSPDRSGRRWAPSATSQSTRETAPPSTSALLAR